MNSDAVTGSPTIQTYTGLLIDPLNLSPSDINIEDIAHALSNVCRFQGHVKHFYSVAQHLVLCSRLVEPEHKLATLLHDADEAYCCDLAGPLKRNTEIGRLYREIEQKATETIELALGLHRGATSAPEVKHADRFMIHIEGRQLMPENDWARRDVLPEYPMIAQWSPFLAEAKFLDAYSELSA